MRDLMGMMGQIKQLQEKMQQLQAELEATEVTGTSGGGLVSVTLTAKGAMKKVSIDPSLMKADEKRNPRRPCHRRPYRRSHEGGASGRGKGARTDGRPSAAAGNEALLKCPAPSPDLRSSA